MINKRSGVSNCTWVNRFKILVVLVITLLISFGCDNGSSSSDGGDGNTPHAETDYDATGTWRMSNTQTYDTHDTYLEPEEVETVYINQNDDLFTIEFDDGGNLQGSISGTKYLLSFNSGSSTHNITITMVSESAFIGENIVTSNSSNWEGHWELKGTRIN